MIPEEQKYFKVKLHTNGKYMYVRIETKQKYHSTKYFIVQRLKQAECFFL